MSDTSQLPRVTVFVCYSRTDKEFADRLAESLEGSADANVKILIDRRDLPYGERWWDMLRDFIQRSDRILFLVSPTSIKSDWCQKELDEIRRVGRRLIPIVVRDTPIADLPDDIRAIQLLPFTPPNVFETQVARLVTALYQNVEWSRQRRLVDTLSEHWAEQNKPASLLLGSEQVARFEQWITKRPGIEPPLSEVSSRYLDFSGFHSNRELHFVELRRLRDRAASGWLNWAYLVGGYLTVVGAACYGLAHLLSDGFYLIAGWLSSAVAGGAAAVPIGRAIQEHNHQCAQMHGEKVAFIEGYGALDEANAFIEKKEAEEAEAAKRERDAQELKRLREEVSRAKRAPSKPSATASPSRPANAPAPAYPLPTKDDPLP